MLPVIKIINIDRKVTIVGKVDAKYTIRDPLCNVDEILIASVLSLA